MAVWQARDRNEWDVAIRQALAGPEGPTAVAGEGPDPFSLADPTTVEGILRAAGFAEISLTDVREPIYFGPATTAALGWVRGFVGTKEFLKRLDPAAAARALARLRDALAARMTDEGVWFDSRAWIVTARPPLSACGRTRADRTGIPGTGKDKGKELDHSLPLPTYSAPGALRQDPGRAAGSSIEARIRGRGYS